MRKSQQLRNGDFRGIYRLVGECREMGEDAIAWRGRLCRGLKRLIDVPSIAGGEAESLQAVPRLMLHESEPPAAKSRFLAWITAGKQHVEEPLWLGFPAVGPAIARRDQIVSDRDWYKSFMFNEILRPDGVDGFIVSSRPLPGGLQDFLSAQARPGRLLGRFEMRMVYHLHREIAPLVGRALAGSWEPSLDALSRRMRQTLDALLEGDSEKQVALRLGVSPETVHVYVKKLYQHFGVASRPELMAHFLRRYRNRRALIGGADPTGVSIVS